MRYKENRRQKTAEEVKKQQPRSLVVRQHGIEWKQCERVPSHFHKGAARHRFESDRGSKDFASVWIVKWLVANSQIMKSGLHKKWLTDCNRLVLAMLVIDSEARSRKFPATPTCSIQADALKI